MAKQRWVPDTAQFEQAVNELHSAYGDIIHQQTTQALADQAAMLERMRKLEKSTSATAARISKQLRADYEPVARESTLLSKALGDSQRAVAETIATVQRIDALLPAMDRLEAPGKPHRRHYPHLHRAAAATVSFRLPDLVEHAGKRAPPHIQLNSETANAASTNARDVDGEPHGI